MNLSSALIPDTTRGAPSSHQERYHVWESWDADSEEICAYFCGDEQGLDRRLVDSSGCIPGTSACNHFATRALFLTCCMKIHEMYVRMFEF